MRRQTINSIELKDVALSFTDDAPLFNGLAIKLSVGKAINLEGPPGCGKSLLLKLMAGLMEPTQGEILYNETSLNEMSFEQFAPLRTATSICFENGGLLMNRTLLENLKLPLLYNNQWSGAESQDLLDELVSSFEIKDFLNHRPASVSAGVRKIAALVRSFLCRPQVLFLDQPSLGIGERGFVALQHWLERYRQENHQEKIVVMASSNQKLMETLQCERWCIKNGFLLPVVKESEKAA